MALQGDADPRGMFVRAECGQRDAPRQWSNVQPLDRVGAGAVGQWAELLASISHELRTPLNAVIGFSEAMQQEVFGPIGNVRYREYASHIRTSGVELLNAAEDALAMTAVLAQPKASALEDVGLAAIIGEALEDLECVLAVRRIGIVVDVGHDVEVRTDRRILPRAMRQMVGLALSRAEVGSELSLSARVEHGLVDVVVEVREPLPGASLQESIVASTRTEMGLGRRELALWLATSLLDLLDCRLQVETRHGALMLRTTLEQSTVSLFAGAR